LIIHEEIRVEMKVKIKSLRAARKTAVSVYESSIQLQQLTSKRLEMCVEQDIFK